jgi:DNA-binding beta-propeller fold protein YncE
VSHKAFVVNGLNSYNVSSIDIYSNSIIGINQTLGNTEGRVAFNSYTDTLFTTIPDANQFLIQEGNTNKILANVSLSDSPSDIIFNPATNLVNLVDNKPSLNILNILNATTWTLKEIRPLYEQPTTMGINFQRAARRSPKDCCFSNNFRCVCIDS